MPPESRSPLTGPTSPRAPRSPSGSSPERGSGAGALVWLGAAIAVVTGVGAILSEFAEPDDPEALVPPPLPGQIPLGSASGGPSDRAAPPPRCTRVAPEESFVIGEAPTRGADAPIDAPPGIPGLDTPGGAIDEGAASPFAVVLGRGIATPDGFAFGALRDAEGGTIATVGTLDRDGRNGRVVRLARSRGDVDAPIVAAGPAGSLLVALLEPNAGGRAMRLARVVAGEVTWGAELTQGADESLALDLAVSGGRALVAWDDAGVDEGSRIAVSSFAADDVAVAAPPRAVSPKRTSADSPRLAPRPGGFWLAYVARGEEAPRVARPKEAIDRIDDEEIDEESGGERIETSWVEIVPLDENGAATGGPARVTPREGTVLGFDLAQGADGGAVLAWRDDASPTGGGGGTVRVAYVGAGGVGEIRPLVDEDVDDGVPDLLGLAGGGGWIAVSSIKGWQSLGRIDDRGVVLGAVAPESSLGHAEAIAAVGDRLLLATPEGRAMRLRVVACSETAAPVAPDPAAPPAAD